MSLPVQIGLVEQLIRTGSPATVDMIEHFLRQRRQADALLKQHRHDIADGMMRLEIHDAPRDGMWTSGRLRNDLLKTDHKSMSVAIIPQNKWRMTCQKCGSTNIHVNPSGSSSADEDATLTIHCYDCPATIKSLPTTVPAP